MSSTESRLDRASPAQPGDAGAESARVLREVALLSLENGVRTGRPLVVDPVAYAPPLREPRAVFVTLFHLGQLRGCIGSLEPHEPLVVAVAQNAFRAGFRDPRFDPLSEAELADLALEISLLGPLAPLRFGSEQELLSLLRPGVDGLLLRDGPHQGTFLPAVWEALPEPADFLRELKRKAGLHPEHWSPTIAVSRYTVEKIA
jgi:AmmeMemoRadiSam system protein A